MVIKESKFEVGQRVVFQRGTLKGASNIIKKIHVSIDGANGWFYVLRYHPNGELFKETELKAVE